MSNYAIRCRGVEPTLDASVTNSPNSAEPATNPTLRSHFPTREGIANTNPRGSTCFGGLFLRKRMCTALRYN